MALKRIKCREVGLGMFIERMEGDWLDHPFWRSGFVLEKAADLEKLIASPVEYVVIDDAKGLGIAAPAPARAPARGQAGTGARSSSGPSAASHAGARTARIDRSVRECGRAMGEIFAQTRLGRSIDPATATRVMGEIVAALDTSPQTLLELTRLKSADRYTYLHSIAVSALMMGFTRHLEFDDDMVHLMGVAGLMHDIGKVVISPVILNKPGALTEREVEIIRLHPAAGYEILKRDGFPDIVLDVALHHHERIDGSGYPERIGPEISPHARIAALCDVYDAVTSIRPYKRAWTQTEALAQMAVWTGHFDPAYFKAFVAYLGRDEAELAELASPVAGFSENGYSDPTGGA